MSLQSRTIDFPLDALIQRHGCGFQLINNPIENRSSLKSQLPLHRLDASLFNVYFLNVNSEYLYGNERVFTSCGFSNFKDPIGKSAYDVFEKKEALEVLANDRNILQTGKIKIVEEHVLRKDNQAFLYALSFKSPWVDQQNRTLGIFGCSIILNQQPIAESLALMQELGFFDCDDPLLNRINRFSPLLNKREKQCLYYTIQGKTAREISIIINLSHRTVEQYLSNIKYKLSVPSRSALIEKVLA